MQHKMRLSEFLIKMEWKAPAYYAKIRKELTIKLTEFIKLQKLLIGLNVGFDKNNYLVLSEK